MQDFAVFEDLDNEIKSLDLVKLEGGICLYDLVSVRIWVIVEELSLGCRDLLLNADVLELN